MERIVHSITEVWECPKCKKVFISEDKMLIHISKEHSKNWRCPKCNNVFISEDEMLNHFSEEHSKIKNRKIEKGWVWIPNNKYKRKKGFTPTIKI